MWNLRLQSKSQDPRFDRRSFRTFGRKSKPLPEPAVSYSALSGGVHIGFPSSSPPPPPPTFAQIGSKTKIKSQNRKAPQPPLPPTTFVESEKPKKRVPFSINSPSLVKPSVSPTKNAPSPRNHPSTTKTGCIIWVAVPGTQTRDHPSVTKRGSTIWTALPKKSRKEQKRGAIPKAVTTSVAKLSPVRKAPPPPSHSSIIKSGSVIQVSATKNPDGFVPQELSPVNESQLI